MPGFFGPFFYQGIVLKILLKLHSNCMFFSHFCNNYHQNYHNYHHNYHCKLHYQHQIFFRSYAQNVVFDVKKEDQVARIGVRGRGLGDSGNARKKMFLFPLMPSLSSLEVIQVSSETCLVHSKASSGIGLDGWIDGNVIIGH